VFCGDPDGGPLRSECPGNQKRCGSRYILIGTITIEHVLERSPLFEGQGTLFLIHHQVWRNQGITIQGDFTKGLVLTIS
jgi:hypothetical protein